MKSFLSTISPTKAATKLTMSLETLKNNPMLQNIHWTDCEIESLHSTVIQKLLSTCCVTSSLTHDDCGPTSDSQNVTHIKSKPLHWWHIKNTLMHTCHAQWTLMSTLELSLTFINWWIKEWHQQPDSILVHLSSFVAHFQFSSLLVLFTHVSHSSLFQCGFDS